MKTSLESDIDVTTTAAALSLNDAHDKGIDDDGNDEDDFEDEEIQYDANEIQYVKQCISLFQLAFDCMKEGLAFMTNVSDAIVKNNAVPAKKFSSNSHSKPSDSSTSDAGIENNIESLFKRIIESKSDATSENSVVTSQQDEINNCLLSTDILENPELSTLLRHVSLVLSLSPDDIGFHNLHSPAEVCIIQCQVWVNSLVQLSKAILDSVTNLGTELYSPSEDLPALEQHFLKLHKLVSCSLSLLQTQQCIYRSDASGELVREQLDMTKAKILSSRLAEIHLHDAKKELCSNSSTGK